MSIRAKLIGFFTAVMLVTGLITSALWYNDTMRMIDRYLQDYSLSIMENSYDAFSYLLTDTQYILNMIATNDTSIVKPLERKDLSQLQRIETSRKIESVVDEMYGYKYYISGIGVLTREGDFFKVGPSVQPKQILQEIETNQAQFENGWRTAVLSPVVYTETSTRDKLIPVVRPIDNLRGERLGYALVYLNHQIVQTMLSENLPEGSRFEVVSGAGDIIFSNSPDFKLQAAEKLNLFRVKDKFIYSQFYAEQTDWYFNMGIPASGMIDDLVTTIKNTAMIYALIYTVALAVVILFSYRVSRRLGVLSGAMNSVSGGDLTVRVPALGADEIGRMGGIFNYMVGKIKELLDRVQSEENQKREAELDFLQAQINPHFLSNTLNTVVWMANVQNAGNISRLTTSLISLLHTTMRRGREFIEFAEELEQIKSYIEIEQCCYFDNFEATFDVADDLLEYMVPRFIIQPIVENALIHALPKNTARMGEIHISANLGQNRLCIYIRDNGIGMSGEQIVQILQTSPPRDSKAFSSIGIKNVNDRLRLFFGEGYGLSFESKLGEYTTVTITIPVIPAEKQGKAHLCE